MLWGMGSFAQVTTERLPWLAVPVLVGTLAALRLVKPLNACCSARLMRTAWARG